MVNSILPTSIIRDNPDIEYKPFLEYLDGDDLYQEKPVNEMKSFLCNNVLYNDELVYLNDKLVKLDQKPVLETVQCTFGQPDTKLFQRYNEIRSYFQKVTFSYDDLYNLDEGNTKFNSFNSRLFTTTGSDYQIVPVVYGDFYGDIDIEHMMNDYSSFSVVVDYTKGIIYINDVLLNHLKMNRRKRYDVMCNILVNKAKICWGCDVYEESLQNDNGKRLLERIKADSDIVEDFVLDCIPHRGVFSVVKNPSQFVTDDHKTIMSISNVQYDTYVDFSTIMNGTLYHNDEFGYFSEDKNRTAINVLAYDIARNGLRKPIVVNKYNGKFIVQSKTRFLIAQYLRLPSIPVIFYTMLVPKSRETSSVNVLERSQYKTKEFSHNLRKALFPQISEKDVDNMIVW